MLDVVREVEEFQRRMRDKAERDSERFQFLSDQRARDQYLFFREQQIYDQRNADPMATARTLAVIVVGLFFAVRFVVVGLGRLLRKSSNKRASPTH
jgi:hypothetical protein